MYMTIGEPAVAVTVKVAVTEVAVLKVSTQLALPVHAPLQPANVKPDAGAAVSVTVEPVGRLALHPVVAPAEQLIPAGELETVPPLPAVTDNVDVARLTVALAVALPAPFVHVSA